MTERKVRVRFAPSPTGGVAHAAVCVSAYTIIFFARQHGGDFIFRIEDTDSNRFVPGAEEYILESFKWLGIPFDEGVSFGGDHGPYRQSERREIYKKYVQILLEAGKATSLSILLRSWKQSVRRLRISSTMLLPACRCAIH